MQCPFYFVTLAEPYLATGRGLWEATPLDLLSQTNQVCGWIYFFKLSYFDCSDLQLFAIFMAEELVGPLCVQIVSLRKQKTPIEVGVYMELV